MLAIVAQGRGNAGPTGVVDLAPFSIDKYDSYPYDEGKQVRYSTRGGNMGIRDLREELIGARQQIAEGRPEKALERIDRALEELNTSLLTTMQAKDWLGLGSVNTLKMLVRKTGMQVEMHGNRMMIPRSELENLQNSPLLRSIRDADRFHEQSAELGVLDGLSERQLRDLEDARPGSLPWSTKSPAEAV